MNNTECLSGLTSKYERAVRSHYDRVETAGELEKEYRMCADIVSGYGLSCAEIVFTVDGRSVFEQSINSALTESEMMSLCDSFFNLLFERYTGRCV